MIALWVQYLLMVTLAGVTVVVAFDHLFPLGSAPARPAHPGRPTAVGKHRRTGGRHEAQETPR